MAQTVRPQRAETRELAPGRFKIALGTGADKGNTRPIDRSVRPLFFLFSPGGFYGENSHGDQTLPGNTALVYVSGGGARRGTRRGGLCRLRWREDSLCNHGQGTAPGHAARLSRFLVYLARSDAGTVQALSGRGHRPPRLQQERPAQRGRELHG